jgi:hypothetical protein
VLVINSNKKGIETNTKSGIAFAKPLSLPHSFSEAQTAEQG